MEDDDDDDDERVDDKLAVDDDKFEVDDDDDDVDICVACSSVVAVPVAVATNSNCCSLTGDTYVRSPSLISRMAPCWSAVLTSFMVAATMVVCVRNFMH